MKNIKSMDEDFAGLEEQKNSEYENKPLSELVKEKRENTEKLLESTKLNQ